MDSIRQIVQSSDRLEDYRPDYYLEKARRIKGADLRMSGIRAIVLDCDNTLMKPSSFGLDRRTIGWIRKELQDEGIAVCIASHCPAVWRWRLARIEERLQVPVVAVDKTDPRDFELKVMRVMRHQSHEIAIVGDQLRRDIWWGKQAGVGMTILVKPITRIEWPITAVNRLMERQLRRQLQLGAPLSALPTNVPPPE